jgi:DNA invertase Pin-like site-specific DNA recombinase
MRYRKLLIPNGLSIMSQSKAYSYLRFSTPEQAKGDSKRRQTELAEAWAIRHGMELDTELTMQDLGVSAYRGDNSKRGALSLFRRAVEDGLVAQGSVLLVENLDRISRQAPWDALPIFQSIINEGVDIITLADEKRWSKEELRENPLRIMESLLVFIRANEESRTKSKRLAAVWSNKRRRASEGHISTARIPAWLEVVEKNGKREIKANAERSKVVKKIFKWASEGLGQHAIAQRLNDEGMPTFGGSRFWQRSYIAKLLKSEAVVGTYTPAIMQHEGEKKIREKQKPIAGYFPLVVSRTVFEKVQLATSEAPRGKARGGVVQNMLAGLAKCGMCGSTMTRVNKGPKGGRPKLVCTKAKAGAGCSYHSIDLDKLENALVENAEQIVEGAPKPLDLWEEIIDLRNEKEGLQKQIQNLATEIAVKPSQALRALLLEVENRADQIEIKIKEMTRKEEASVPATLKRRLETLKRALQERHKGEINVALRATIKHATIEPIGPNILFRWKHSETPSMLLCSFNVDEIIYEKS